MNKTVEEFIGNTPLVRLQRLPGTENPKNRNVLLAKLEGNNPAGSVKDRPAISMIRHAERRGAIKPGDTLIEPTSGNTGIALAMAAAIRGYRMVLIMPEHLSAERRQTMRAFGAEIILTPREGGMEAARDLAERMVREKKGTMLDQFANPDNPRVHYETTGPEIWRDTEGRITHFVSSMGTTGTIMGCSRFFKEKNARIQIIGCQPQEGSQIPGIRKWPEAYLPKIYDKARVDRLEYVSQAEAEDMTRRLAREEGIFAGISSGGAVHVALRVSKELKNAVIVTVICDRGDRYLTTGVFPDEKNRGQTPTRQNQEESGSDPDLSAVTPILAFDIETVPDVAGIRRLYDLPADLPDHDVAEIALQKRRVQSGVDFLPPHLHRIVAIGCVLREDDAVQVFSIGEPERDEAATIQKFFDGIDKYTPQLVSWNGSSFDLPVLSYRTLLCGGCATKFWDQGADDPDFRYNNYVSRYHARHCDLMDVLAMYQPRNNAPLDQVAQLAGLPGKLGIGGPAVWAAYLKGEIRKIRDYCEGDCVNTYLLYLRFQRQRGILTQEQHDKETALLRSSLQATGKPYWQEFLALWKT